MESSEADIRQNRIDEAKRMYSIMQTSMSDEAIRAIAVFLFDEANQHGIPVEDIADGLNLFTNTPAMGRTVKIPARD